MSDNQYLLDQLKSMIGQKRSIDFYAKKLGITRSATKELLLRLRHPELNKETKKEIKEGIVNFSENIDKGEAEFTANVLTEIVSLEDLIEKTKIDTDVWEISRYIQNYWGNDSCPHWQVKAFLTKKSDECLFENSFVKFLETYSPSYISEQPPIHFPLHEDACLIINKQDLHANKFDVYGDNNIHARLRNVVNKTETIIKQAFVSNNITDVTYIIGSDEFNSEFTNTTTKGTPQQNISTHHEAFEEVCNHEVEIVRLLLTYSNNISVVYVAGNHDEYMGWYMVKWLESYFRNEKRVKFDVSPRYRKYISYGDTAMMFNHGDALKPQKLANLFPIEYRENWSNHNHFLIFTGDKHHEMSLDFNGIKFYQLPALSPAKSLWDEKNGYISKAEMTGFLIEKDKGLTNIFKQYL